MVVCLYVSALQLAHGMPCNPKLDEEKKMDILKGKNKISVACQK